jgi:4-hydroxy-3-polyprenylbenzoate decarboxylase
MPYRNLADFLEDLGRAGELAPVDAEVDPCLEVAEVTRRIARQNGPALLFRNVKGHDIPLVTNLFGTESRILRALGADSIEEATERIDRALSGGGSEVWLERLRFGGKGGATASFAANKVKSGPCQQVVQIGSDINLRELPLPRVTDHAVDAPRDAQSAHRDQPRIRRAIHSAVMLSAEPNTHAQIFLQGDIQIIGRDTALAAWSDVSDPARLVRQYDNHGARMPLAVIVGGDPAVRLAAAAPMPAALDPLGLAGLLREQPLDAVPCRGVDLLVPGESDFVLEGYIDPVANDTGAFPRLSPTGRVLQGRLAHVVHITAVTHRANRVFPAVSPGIDDCECPVRDRLLARLFVSYLKLQIPELVDFDLPLSGNARHVAVLAIEKTYAGQARQVATTAWGMRPFKSARLLIVVDAEVDVRDMDEVLAAIVREANWLDDLWGNEGPGDPLDPTIPWHRNTRRLGIDATRRLKGEGRERPAAYVRRDESVVTLVNNRWAEYGLGPEEGE